MLVDLHEKDFRQNIPDLPTKHIEATRHQHWFMFSGAITFSLLSLLAVSVKQRDDGFSEQIWRNLSK